MNVAYCVLGGTVRTREFTVKATLVCIAKVTSRCRSLEQGEPDLEALVRCPALAKAAERRPPNGVH